MESCNPAATAGKLRKSHLDEQHAHGHRKSAVWNRKRVNRMNFDEVPENFNNKCVEPAQKRRTRAG